MEEKRKQVDPLDLFSVVPSGFDIGKFLKTLKECNQSRDGMNYEEFLKSMEIDQETFFEIGRRVGVTLYFKINGNIDNILVRKLPKEIDEYIEIYEKMKTNDDKTEENQEKSDIVEEVESEPIQESETKISKITQKDLNLHYPDDSMIRMIEDFCSKLNINLSEEEKNNFRFNRRVEIDGRTFVIKDIDDGAQDLGDNVGAEVGIFEEEIVEEVEQSNKKKRVSLEKNPRDKENTNPAGKESEVEPEPILDPEVLKQIEELKKKIQWSKESQKKAESWGREDDVKAEKNWQKVLQDKIDKLKEEARTKAKIEPEPILDPEVLKQIEDLQKKIQWSKESQKKAESWGREDDVKAEKNWQKVLQDKIDKLKEEARTKAKIEPEPILDPEVLKQIEDLKKKIQWSKESQKKAESWGREDDVKAEKNWQKVLQDKIDKLKEEARTKAKVELEPILDPEVLKQIAKIEDELAKSAKRMKEYRDIGAYDQEAYERSHRQELLEKINKLRNPDPQQSLNVEPQQNLNANPQQNLEPQPNQELASQANPEPEPEQIQEEQNAYLFEETLTFEEILHKVQAARNALSDGEMSRYECATGGWLVPVRYDKGDWLRNSARFLVQGVLGSIVNIPRKIYSMIRTGRKQEEKVANITQNVNELPKDEFKVLVEGLESYKGHENLVSASLRNAVYARQRRETNELNMLRNRQISQALNIIKENYNKSNELESQLQAGNLSDAQQNRLWAEITKLDREAAENVRLVEALREQGSLEQGGSGLHGLEEESRAAREGSNLSGRKFARRFSKNEYLEDKQAALKKQQRLAYQKGDDYGEVSAFIEHERLLSENTYSKKNLGITVSRGDRNHRADGIFSKEYKPDDLARNLATIAAVTATTVNIMKQMHNQAIVQQRNAEATAANDYNGGMAAKAENLRNGIINQKEVVNNGIKGTEDLNKVAAFGVGHHNVGTKYNFTGKWGSTVEDQMFHQVMQGDVNFDTLRNFIKEGLPTIGKYAQTHSQYEYGPLLEAMKNLEQGGITAIEQYNFAAKQLVQNAINTGKLSAESVSMIELSPTYIETMLPLVLAGKAVTSKEYREAEKRAVRAERRAKREQNPFFKGIKFRRADRDDDVLDVDQFEDDEYEFPIDSEEKQQQEGDDR